MAGGKLAEHVTCLVCVGEGQLTKATRIYEGAEDDQYQCEKGHQFGMDWRTGPATETLWPPNEEMIELAKSSAE